MLYFIPNDVELFLDGSSKKIIGLSNENKTNETTEKEPTVFNTRDVIT